LQSNEVRRGVRVRVREGHRKSEYDGVLGTVKGTFGHRDYVAVDVQLEDGRLELFWHYQLDKADEKAVGA
jgi:hypothetical protein